MCLDMFLNDASLPYQYLGDSQAENAVKYKYIASLENTLKTKVERVADLEQSIINNSLINSASTWPHGSVFFSSRLPICSWPSGTTGYRSHDPSSDRPESIYSECPEGISAYVGSSGPLLVAAFNNTITNHY